VKRNASTPCLGQERDRACPVGAPHATVEAERIKDADERVPNVAVREGFMRERAGTDRHSGVRTELSVDEFVRASIAMR
jgi:hypothetical protein